MISITQGISSSNILSAAAFAAISIVALLVSFMTSSYLYARSTLIPYGVLLALSFILLELLIMVYYSTLSEFGDLLMKKSGKAIPNVPDTTKAEAEHDEGERQVEIYEQSVKVNHILTDEAREKLKNNVHDYLYWQMQDKKTLKRINMLLQDIKRNPFEGLGKPEPLKHNLQGLWSRRIDDENRIVYYEKNKVTYIVACRGHYDD